jgi:hypothetical protein
MNMCEILNLTSFFLKEYVFHLHKKYIYLNRLCNLMYLNTLSELS